LAVRNHYQYSEGDRLYAGCCDVASVGTEGIYHGRNVCQGKRNYGFASLGCFNPLSIGGPPPYLENTMGKFLASAPVLAAVWMTITAGILIEFNRFFPDLLFHPL
jgi:photosystem I subunit IX